MKKYSTPKSWHGGMMPNGKETYDFNEYYYSWHKLIDSLEKITGLQVTGYDPSISLAKIVDGKYITAKDVQLPLWFAKLLVEKFTK